jgi:polysaccharide export outer membrane protein
VTSLRLPLIACLLPLVLAGCDLPRGAAEQREILGEAETEESTFEIHQVTRATLPMLVTWPMQAPTNVDGWIDGSGGAPGQIIQPGDTVHLTVWDNEERSLLTSNQQKVVELSGLTVSPSGTVFLPYVSDVYIASMSPEDARAAIQDKMVMIVPSAQVQLTHEPGLASSFDLISGVRSAGSFPLLSREMTVLGAIALGGGVVPELENPQVRLLRDGRQFGISLDRLLESPELDTRLRGGDKIYVEADERYFLALGAAGRESRIPFPDDTVTVLDGTALLGGINPTRGDPKGVLVLRDYPASALRSDGTGPGKDRVVFAFDLTTGDGLFSAGDFPLQHRDVLLISESPLTSTRTIISIVFETLGIAVRASDLADDF